MVEPRLVGVKQVAEMLGVGRCTVFAMVKDGRLPAPQRWGPRTVRWHVEDIERHLRQGPAGGPPPTPGPARPRPKTPAPPAAAEPRSPANPGEPEPCDLAMPGMEKLLVARQETAERAAAQAAADLAKIRKRAG